MFKCSKLLSFFKKSHIFRVQDAKNFWKYAISTQNICFLQLLAFLPWKHDLFRKITKVWKKKSEPKAVFGGNCVYLQNFIFCLSFEKNKLLFPWIPTILWKKQFSASTLLSSQEYDTLLYNRRNCYWCTKIAYKFLYCFLFFIADTILR